jgi:hypothetical protein
VASPQPSYRREPNRISFPGRASTRPRTTVTWRARARTPRVASPST